MNIEELIKQIPEPTIVESLDYEKIVAAMKDELIKKFGEYDAREGDAYMPLIEAFAYREIALRNKINHAIKNMLLVTATGPNLDNIAAAYGTFRKPGKKPTTKVTLTYTSKEAYKKIRTDSSGNEFISDEPVIDAGTVFVDNSGHKAVLLTDTVLRLKPEQEAKVTFFTEDPSKNKKYVYSGEGVLELDKYVAESMAVTNIISTPIPFLGKPVIKDAFRGGESVESDDSLRLRTIEAFERFSTAGSRSSYEYHARAASEKIKDVYVKRSSDKRHVVEVYLLSSDNYDIIKKADLDKKSSFERMVKDYLSADNIRPLTDEVNVTVVTPNNIDITIEVEILNDGNKDIYESTVKSRLNGKLFKMGEDLNLSWLYSIFHTDYVYRVKITNPSADVNVNEDTVITIGEVNFKYKEVSI